MKKIISGILCAAVTLASFAFTSYAAMTRWDVDSDDSFNKDDIRAMGEYIVGKREISSEQFSAADINGDGASDCFDLIRMRKELYNGVRTLKFSETQNLLFSGYKTTSLPSMIALQTKQDMRNYLRDFLDDETAESIVQKYTDDTLEENVLLIYPTYQENSDVPLKSVKQVNFVKGNLTVVFDGIEPMKYTNQKGVLIEQVLIPEKEYYASSIAVRTDAKTYKYSAAAKVLRENGWSLETAFRKASEITYYGNTNEVPQDYKTSMEWYANYGFSNGKGNDYVMAAMFCEMAKTLGYECHMVSGQVPVKSGGYGNHAWAEITIGGTVYVCDPDFTNETGRNGYLISYGQSGIWKYVKERTMS